MGYPRSNATGARKMTYNLEFERGKHVAVCTCGWRSERVSSAGLAGSQFDTHKQEAHQ